MRPLKKPDWLRVRLPQGKASEKIESLIAEHKLHTVCKEAQCPNRGECWGDGTATFLILGDTCTRNCRFCNVKTGRPGGVDQSEAGRIASATVAIQLNHLVVTSVTRDDLSDGGASLFSETVRQVKQLMPACSVEVLIPDFKGNVGAVHSVCKAQPDIIAHTSLMLGMGETRDEVRMVMDDLRRVGCDILVMGQYLCPSKQHWPVVKYLDFAEFDTLKEEALSLGFSQVVSGPLVRSSYRAGTILRTMNK